MKKILLLLFFAVSIYSCSDSNQVSKGIYNEDNTILKNGVFYDKLTNTPLNGSIMKFYTGDSDKIKEELVVENGYRISIKKYYKSSRLEEETSYNLYKGNIISTSKYYTKDGIFRQKTIYKNDIKGIVESYYDNGKIEWRRDYKENGDVERYAEYDEAGKLKEATSY